MSSDQIGIRLIVGAIILLVILLVIAGQPPTI